ncbi:MAG: hypothetical protein HGB35_01615 [Geobacteraceae bacterium]|nr:hypothetical protein [Geobacteraceae bacterium]
MIITEFKEIASQHNRKVGTAARGNLVRAIQQPEENQLCFSCRMYV